MIYLIPVCITLFSKDEDVHDVMLKIALFPSLFLFFCETIQMREQGLEYFMGWNIVDTMQFLSFISLQYFTYNGDDKVKFVPELKFVLTILAFMKLLFFIRIFERFGFLV